MLQKDAGKYFVLAVLCYFLSLSFPEIISKHIAAIILGFVLLILKMCLEGDGGYMVVSLFLLVGKLDVQIYCLSLLDAVRTRAENPWLLRPVLCLDLTLLHKAQETGESCKSSFFFFPWRTFTDYWCNWLGWHYSQSPDFKLFFSSTLSPYHVVYTASVKPGASRPSGCSWHLRSSAPH